MIWLISGKTSILEAFLCMCLRWKESWERRWVWMGVGFPYPPIHNDIVTPCHLLHYCSCLNALFSLLHYFLRQPACNLGNRVSGLVLSKMELANTRQEFSQSSSCSPRVGHMQRLLPTVNIPIVRPSVSRLVGPSHFTFFQVFAVFAVFGLTAPAQILK